MQPCYHRQPRGLCWVWDVWVCAFLKKRWAETWFYLTWHEVWCNVLDWPLTHKVSESTTVFHYIEVNISVVLHLALYVYLIFDSRKIRNKLNTLKNNSALLLICWKVWFRASVSFRSESLTMILCRTTDGLLNIWMNVFKSENWAEFAGSFFFW